ncbi:response regulator [Aliiglaciecola sp. CAU 1673]|uniref:tetratricopeptide repeat-containing response regulator n=1 Tax=Aliiglaciecola sp. CAU 1673 TaxID=3032595 RepID=UPI0023DA0712|nr:tetratricopeptide repeat-containing response regulator [Aliiglaciecola sp. CAU 1673]MDF2177082.1 response regulator [Aliiglaciecola sp. CAU 1673]
MDEKLAKACKVLIVDDQVLAQGYMKYSLEELGFRDVSYVDRAAFALKKIEETHFDLIVCSYNLKKDQDGFYLYDQLKSSHALPLSTAFIFISADTTSELVHSIIELQPDDFLAKPFSVRELDKRLTRVLTRKAALRPIYKLMEKEDYFAALEEVENFLTTPSNAEFFPLALKTKGELLTACGQIKEAKSFYEAIINVQPFSWAQLGLVNALIKLNEDEEAERLILRLAFKPDSQLMAYDLLYALNVKQEDFEAALEAVLMAAEISPRNLRRHRNAIDLSRLTHDYQTQFEAAKRIVKYAKHSIHDKPQNYINVARAGIDYAMTSDDSETAGLVKQANEYIRQFHSTFPKAELDEQIKVVSARLLYLQDEKEKAQALIEQLSGDTLETDDFEDLLDKSKLFHALGLHERCQRVLDEIEHRCTHDPRHGEIFLRYIQQEKREMAVIKQTPKDLNNSAVDLYQKGAVDEALKIFRQAYTVMPKNPSIALNLLQALAMKVREQGMVDGTRQIVERCIRTIENGHLSDEQEERYNKVKNFLQEVH